MDGIGGKSMPTALETTYRIQRNVIQNICEDTEFDIFDLKESLKIEPLLPEPVETVKFDIPREIKLSEKEGLIFCTGFVARKMKKVDPSLGSYKHSPSADQVSSKFLDLYSRGGLTHPSENFLKDTQKDRYI